MTLNFLNNMKKMDFLKYRKTYFFIFATVFAALIAAIAVIILNFSDNFSGNMQNRTTIEIPFSSDLDDEDLKEIKKIADDALEVNCEIQKPEPSEEVNMFQKNNLSINFFSETLKEDISLKEKVAEISTNLKEEFPDKLNIKNLEEILITNHEISDIEDFKTLGNFIIFGILFLILLAYYAIAFRKLNPLFVVLSLIFSLIFNFAVIAATLSILIGILNITINNSLILFAVFSIISVTLNSIINTNSIFNKLKNAMVLGEEYSWHQILNFVLYSKSDLAFNNLLIFSVVPSITFLLLGAINSIINENVDYLFNVFPFTAAYLFSTVVCFFISIFMVLPIWSFFKKIKTN